MSKRKSPARRKAANAHARRKARPAPAARPFTPVATRHRHDGWTPERQVAFVEALAETACVEEAARAVGMSARSAYALRLRADAQSFRLAWEAALDHAVRRLSDAALSRALNGVAVPHFYKGEQIGEHRRYDERLTMFILRYRDPLRYAATLDKMVYEGHPESATLRFARMRDRLDAAVHGEDAGAVDAAGMAEADGPPWTAEPVPDAAGLAARLRDERREVVEPPVVREDPCEALFRVLREREEEEEERIAAETNDDDAFEGDACRELPELPRTGRPDAAARRSAGPEPSPAPPGPAIRSLRPPSPGWP